MNLILIRHGQSEWNQKNLFTGWQDVDLTDQGINEAIEAGRLLKENKIEFQYAYTSILKRANKTLHYVLEETDCLWIPVEKHWRLNERHYGGLTGLNKLETAEKYGAEQVFIWRRSYDVAPPNMTQDQYDAMYQQAKYKSIPADVLPYAESLELTEKRCMPYFYDHIAPRLIKGDNVLVVAHGNSLRAICKSLENISDEEISQIEIATGEPIIYKLDNKLSVISKEVLSP